MITEKVKDKLKANWGVKAACLECMCEIKFIDVFSNWACYIFAMNPQDENMICCLIHHKNEVAAHCWTMQGLHEHYNLEGEYPIIDEEFRPIMANELYKRLQGDG